MKRILLLGTVVRVVLAPFTAHPFDVYAWYTYCAGVLQRGVDVHGILVSFSPLWFLTLVPIAYSYGFLSPILGSRAVSVSELPYQFNPQYGVGFVPGPLFSFLVKIPMLMADVATTLILYKMVTQFLGKEKARKAALLFYLSPICIWISAAWGQNDAIPALFTILSMYLLLNEKIVLSGFSLLAATLFKVYPAVFLVPVSVYLLKKGCKEGLLKYHSTFFVPLLMFLLVSLVVSGTWLVNGFASFVSVMFYSTSTFFGAFGFGLTYWSASLLYPLDPNVWAPVSSVLMAILVFVSFYYVLRVRYNAPLKGFAVSTFLLTAAFFLSLRIVPENRFLWLLPFLTLMVAEGLVSWKAYGLLSVTSFLYAQKNFPYYLLPLATINQAVLKPLFGLANPYGRVVNGDLLPTPASATILAVLGTAFSIVMLVIYVRAIQKVRMEANKSKLSPSNIYLK